jgi:hypothetical protein
LYFAYISIVAFSVGCLCHVLEVYICRRMRGVAGIRVARGNYPVKTRLVCSESRTKTQFLRLSGASDDTMRDED